MLLTSSENISNQNISTIGLVQANVVRAKHIGKSFLAGLRAIAGGEIVEFTELMYEARQIAVERMINEARRLGADAVVSVRFSTCSVMDGSSEVMVYGTAVKFV